MFPWGSLDAPRRGQWAVTGHSATLAGARIHTTAKLSASATTAEQGESSSYAERSGMLDLSPGVPAYWMTFTNAYPFTWRFKNKLLSSLPFMQRSRTTLCAMLPPGTTPTRVQPHVQDGSLLVQYVFDEDIEAAGGLSGGDGNVADATVTHTTARRGPTLLQYASSYEALLPVIGSERVPVSRTAALANKRGVAVTETTPTSGSSPSTPEQVVHAVNEKLAAKFERGGEWRLGGLLAGSVRAHAVWGLPHVTDMAFRTPSGWVEIDISGPQPCQEVIFTALRQYGRLYSLVINPEDGKTLTHQRQIAKAAFTSVRSAVAATHGLHRARLGSAELHMRNSGQFWLGRLLKLVEKYPRVAAAAAVSAATGFSVMLMQPIRVANVDERLSYRAHRAFARALWWLPAALVPTSVLALQDRPHLSIVTLPPRASPSPPQRPAADATCRPCSISTAGEGAASDASDPTGLRAAIAVPIQGARSMLAAWWASGGVASHADEAPPAVWLGRWEEARTKLLAKRCDEVLCLIGPQLCNHVHSLVVALLTPNAVDCEESSGVNHGGRAHVGAHGDSYVDQTSVPNATVVYLDMQDLVGEGVTRGGLVSNLGELVGLWPAQGTGSLVKLAQAALPTQFGTALPASASTSASVDAVLNVVTAALKRMHDRQPSRRVYFVIHDLRPGFNASVPPEKPSSDDDKASAAGYRDKLLGQLARWSQAISELGLGRVVFVLDAAHAEDQALLGDVTVCELQPAPMNESAQMVAALVHAKAGTDVEVDIDEVYHAVERIGTRPSDLSELASHLVDGKSPAEAAEAVVQEAAGKIRQALMGELPMPYSQAPLQLWKVIQMLATAEAIPYDAFVHGLLEGNYAVAKALTAAGLIRVTTTKLGQVQAGPGNPTLEARVVHPGSEMIQSACQALVADQTVYAAMEDDAAKAAAATATAGILAAEEELMRLKRLLESSVWGGAGRKALLARQKHVLSQLAAYQKQVPPV